VASERQGIEAHESVREPLLDEFLRQELSAAAPGSLDSEGAYRRQRPPVEELDDLFRWALQEILAIASVSREIGRGKIGKG
jgi:hypothetical protein